MITLSQAKWDRRYLSLAELVSGWSKDPSTKTGAVLVGMNNRIVSVGYNGFPPGIADDARLNDRETKYKTIIHCEVNAVLSAGRPVRGATLYTVPFLSCPPCASIMIQAGIVRVVSFVNYNERWAADLAVAESLLREAGVEVSTYS